MRPPGVPDPSEWGPAARRVREARETAPPDPTVAPDTAGEAEPTDRDGE